MNFDISYVFREGAFGVIRSVPFYISIAVYVLTALALYSMAARRGIRHGWLAWVPVADIWLLGSLSDQYRYVVKGQVRSRRKLLLGLNIVVWILSSAVLFLFFGALMQAIVKAVHGFSDQQIDQMMIESLLRIGGVSVLLLPLWLILKIFSLMAVYDVYRSCDPETAVLFLVLSIFVPATEAFFLFFSREKEKGMPPRKVMQPERASVNCVDPGPRSFAAAESQAEKEPEKEVDPEHSDKEAPEYL